jgi:hypothetical protein
MYFNIIHPLSFSFPFCLPLVLTKRPLSETLYIYIYNIYIYINHTHIGICVYIYVYMIMLVFVPTFIFWFYLSQMTCELCLSEPGLLSQSILKVSYLTLRSLICFELIFGQGERQESSFSFLHALSSFPTTIY